MFLPTPKINTSTNLNPNPLRCAGCPFQSRCVGTRGPENSPFVIVGESPGNEELRLGAPFLGPSGKMLEETLKAVGLPPHIKPFIVNALSCYPANKDLKRLAAGAHACRGRLIEQITAYPRKVILALGAAAAWATTNDFSIKITQQQGRVVPSPMAEHGIVLTVHPAFLLRNGAGYKEWKKHLGTAADLLKDIKPPEWKPPTWEVVRSLGALERVVEDYTARPQLITGDIETTTLHFMDGKIMMLGITKGDGSHVDIIPQELLYAKPAKRALETLLQGGRWNWQNGAFDMAWLRSIGLPAKVDEDIMLMSYTQNENPGVHDLDSIAQKYIGAPRHKQMLNRYLPNKQASYSAIPKPILYEYAAIDISKTHCAWYPLTEIVEADKPSSKLYREILLPAVPFIVEMRLNGIEVDVAKAEDNWRRLTEQMAEIEEKIQEYAVKFIGTRINIGSPAQLKELLYDKMGLGLKVMATNEAALIAIQRRYDHPIANLLMRWRGLAKARSTYVESVIGRAAEGKKKAKAGHIKHDGFVHPDFKLTGTQTGRLAGASPNMLNQPRGPMIRSQYKAGYLVENGLKKKLVLLEVDLNQAELRSLAIMSGDPTLIDIYTKNEISIHDVTTAAAYAPKAEVLEGGKTYERVRDMLHITEASMAMEGIPVEERPKFVYAQAKMRAKAINFGIVYGRQAHSVAVEFDISVKEADRLIKTWLERYPVAANFIQQCRDAPLQRKTMRTVYGRRKRPGLISRERLQAIQNEFANFPHQSTASDIMLEVAINVWEEAKMKWGALVWNEVYDAIYFRLEADDAKLVPLIERCQQLIREIPVKRGLTRIPFLGDAKVGYDWGHMKDWKGSLVETLGQD